jgi:hypothetical protein
MLWGNFFRTQRDTTKVSSAFLRGLLRASGATIGEFGELILNDQRKGVFL